MRTRFQLLLVFAALATGCVVGPDDANVATANSSTNNGTVAGSNNGTSASNNSSNTASNNATNAGTTSQTTPPNNAMSGTCSELDPAIGPCDPLCQTGCDVGEHCLAANDPAEAICQDAGQGGQGDECNADTECDAGLHCRSVGGGPQVCMAYCSPDGAGLPCPAEHGCVRLAADQRIGACVAIENTCDAVPDDTCADPDECYDTVTGRQCLPSGDGALDDPCDRSSACGPGLRCVGVGSGDRVCRPICDPNGDGAECDDGNCNQLQNSSGVPLTWGACL